MGYTTLPLNKLYMFNFTKQFLVICTQVTDLDTDKREHEQMQISDITISKFFGVEWSIPQQPSPKSVLLLNKCDEVILWTLMEYVH